MPILLLDEPFQAKKYYTFTFLNFLLRYYFLDELNSFTKYLNFTLLLIGFTTIKEFNNF